MQRDHLRGYCNKSEEGGDFYQCGSYTSGKKWLNSGFIVALAGFVDGS